MVDQLHKGECTPFLGAGASLTLPTGTTLSKIFAARYGYPFTDDHNLARVMQYTESVVRDPVYLKGKVCDELQSYRRPSPHDPANPHALLAKFPLQTFLTTNYDDFLVEALNAMGKQPHSAISPWQMDTTGGKKPRTTASHWHRDATDEVGLPEPTADRPLVYHLHGSWHQPSSLVLTESDYLTYLVNMVDAAANDGKHPLPIPVLRAMTFHPLLFIGYSLQDWTFRVLFHGLARSTPRSNQRRHVSVQMMPEVSVSPGDAADKARRYLTHYLNGWNISIFLGTASEFCEQIRRRMG
ncbi:hypothetical protein Plo01_66480 [Planobispora longispora]|uniref:SIR2-like domain-containing protein n=1 Tax=Planobispora longispora TaxID=28887 RepID=A0A8J3RS54_9ACTN|nr:hypothetical protein Plo01_66480 [Planobispora longispora]